MLSDDAGDTFRTHMQSDNYTAAGSVLIDAGLSDQTADDTIETIAAANRCTPSSSRSNRSDVRPRDGPNNIANERRQKEYDKAYGRAIVEVAARDQASRDFARLRAETVGNTADEFLDGEEWLSSIADLPRVLWGTGPRILWAFGEALMIAGATGTGKTTLAGQIVAGLLGLPGWNTLLGHPIVPMGPNEKLLYLAADRPLQTAYALRGSSAVRTSTDVS